LSLLPLVPPPPPPPCRTCSALLFFNFVEKKVTFLLVSDSYTGSFLVYTCIIAQVKIILASSQNVRIFFLLFDINVV
jgi:hypothetical protein